MSVFDEVAELYDRARPHYPEKLFDDLADLACIGPGCRVLEIGPGTGRATVPLAERGCAIVAVELGPNLAAVARRNLARFPHVEVVVAPFEDWPLPPEPFDTVVSATAFHWLDPAVREGKVRAALRPGGTLATFASDHVAGGTEAFFAEVQACYERWDPAVEPPVEPGQRLPGGGGDGYEWEVEYTTATYLDLLRTYSTTLALEPGAREGLLACIADLINTRYGGRVVKRYCSELHVERV